MCDSLTTDPHDRLHTLTRRLLVLQQMFFAASLDQQGQPFTTLEASDTYFGLVELLRETREEIDDLCAGATAPPGDGRAAARHGGASAAGRARRQSTAPRLRALAADAPRRRRR